MSAAPTPQLLTVEEFDRLPDPLGGRYELRHGEAVFVSYPDIVHKKLQRRLRELLQAASQSSDVPGIAETEFPYRPFAEHELWAAEVAFISENRFAAIERWLTGSPELVIEVRSPSNTKAELHDKALTALAGGARECWVVDPEQRSVTVYRSASGIAVYSSGERVPLLIFSTEIDVNGLFAGLG